MSRADLASLNLAQLRALCEKHELPKCRGKGITKAYLRKQLSAILDASDESSSTEEPEESLSEREKVYLQLSKTAWKSISEIVKEAHLPRKETARILYNLLAEGKVIKQSGSRNKKPEWRLPFIENTDISEKPLTAALEEFPLVPGDASTEELRQGYVKLTFQGKRDDKALEKVLTDIEEILKASRASKMRTESYALALPRGAHMKKLVALLQKSLILQEVPEQICETPGGREDSLREPQVPTDMGSREELNLLSEFFTRDLKEYRKFRGSYLYKWGWLLYLEQLLERQPGAASVCIWNAGAADKGFFYNATLNQLIVSPRAAARIRKCIKEGRRFIIGVMRISTERGSHANALIFDTEDKVVSRFEPHGTVGERASQYSARSLDAQLSRWLQNEYPGWTYKRGSKLCPVPGPQVREAAHDLKQAYEGQEGPGGFCQAWALLYIHMRIVNSSYSDEEVVRQMLRWTGRETAEKIRRYAEFIVAEIDPVEYARKSGIRAGKVVAYAEGRARDRKLGLLTHIKDDNATMMLYPRWETILDSISELELATEEETETVLAALKQTSRLQALPKEGEPPAIVLVKLGLPYRTIVGVVRPGEIDVRGVMHEQGKPDRLVVVALKSPLHAEVLHPGDPLYQEAAKFV